MYGKAKIPTYVWTLVFFAIFYAFLFSSNGILITCSILFIPFAYKLFYIDGGTNIIFWGSIFQWLIVSAQVIYCTIFNITFEELMNDKIFPTEYFFYTDFLSILGIYFFSLGIFWVIRNSELKNKDTFWKNYDSNKMMIIYLYVFIIYISLQVVIWAFPSIVQYLYFLLYLKWGFFVAVFIVVYINRPDLFIYIICFILVDFILGLSSYFAGSFYQVLLFALIAFSSVNKKITLTQVVVLITSGVLLFHLAILWTASKKEYRFYVSQGQNEQSVRVSSEEARSKLFELISNVDDLKYQIAIRDVVNRIGYIQYFAAAIRYVPAVKPHQYGKVYTQALEHYLVPRFLDPNKPELDDSKHTNEYTGLNVSGKAQATSFSLGSFADAYIDFGPIFMMIPIFLFGSLVGFFFKTLYYEDIWGVIFTTPFFLLIPVYGADTAKALGAILIYFLVVFTVKKPLRNMINPVILKKK